MKIITIKDQIHSIILCHKILCDKNSPGSNPLVANLDLETSTKEDVILNYRKGGSSRDFRLACDECGERADNFMQLSGVDDIFICEECWGKGNELLSHNPAKIS